MTRMRSTFYEEKKMNEDTIYIIMRFCLVTLLILYTIRRMGRLKRELEAVTEKYRWHWLKLNGDDLPDERAPILILTEVGTALGYRDGEDWTGDGGDNLPKPLAWQYVYLPEMPEDDGPEEDE